MHTLTVGVLEVMVVITVSQDVSFELSALEGIFQWNFDKCGY